MLDKPLLKLNKEFNAIVSQLEKDNANYFITGKAGTGKSTLLNLFTKTTRKKAVVLAPTGIAALNVGGQTIHSFFGFPPRMIHPTDIKKSRYAKLYANVDVIIIDEISMVRADMLDNIDWFLRLNRGEDDPFGGVQMIFFGDMFQLPPVVRNEEQGLLREWGYESPYFFSAFAFGGRFNFEVIELHHVFRQSDRYFKSILDRVRTNQIDEDDLQTLNERYFDDANPKENTIVVSPRNYNVDLINKENLHKINAPEVRYTCKVEGKFRSQLYPTSEVLILKDGAQVIFIKNDPAGRFVNGTLGKVLLAKEDEILVLANPGKDNEEEVRLEMASWEIIRYKLSTDRKKLDTEVIGVFRQYPIKLAWAITIHRSQGQTFEDVVIDLGKGTFASGQTYVALSRCRSLEGITLKQPILPRDIMTDMRIVSFYETFVR